MHDADPMYMVRPDSEGVRLEAGVVPREFKPSRGDDPA